MTTSLLPGLPQLSIVNNMLSMTSVIDRTNAGNRMGIMFKRTYPINRVQAFVTFQFGNTSFIGSGMELWLSNTTRNDINFGVALQQNQAGNQYLVVRHTLTGEGKNYKKISCTFNANTMYVMLLAVIPSTDEQGAKLQGQLMTMKNDTVSQVVSMDLSNNVLSHLQLLFCVAVSSSGTLEARAIHDITTVNVLIGSYGLQPVTLIGAIGTVSTSSPTTTSPPSAAGAILGAIIAILIILCCCMTIAAALCILGYVLRRRKSMRIRTVNNPTDQLPAAQNYPPPASAYNEA
jgi:hypothetical protein